jgi:hypothetical protein
LVEDASIEDRRAQVSRTLAFDGQSEPQHVVAYRQIRQLHVETSGDQSLRDRAASLAVVDQLRTHLNHATTLPARLLRNSPLLTPLLPPQDETSRHVHFLTGSHPSSRRQAWSRS